MIRFSLISPLEANFFSCHFYIWGDGTSTTLKVDLAEAPCNLNFNGNYPSDLSFVSWTGDPAFAPTGALDKHFVTLTFPSPLPAAPLAGTPSGNVNVVFAYKGE